MLAVLMTSGKIQIKNTSAGNNTSLLSSYQFMSSARFCTNPLIGSGTFLLIGLVNPFAKEQSWNQDALFLLCQQAKE